MPEEPSSLDPKFVTHLADDDGVCRWRVTICNFDTGYRKIELLIMLDPDGMLVSTRPSTIMGTTWSPPYDPERT